MWKAQAVAKQRPKMWIPSNIVDNDKAQSLQAVGDLTRIHEPDPALVMVPAHDAAVHEERCCSPPVRRWRWTMVL